MRTISILIFSVMCFAQPALSEQRNLAEGERELLNLLLTASPEVREAIQEYLDEIPLNGDWGLCKQSVSAPGKWELVAVFTAALTGGTASMRGPRLAKDRPVVLRISAYRCRTNCK